MPTSFVPKEPIKVFLKEEFAAITVERDAEGKASPANLLQMMILDRLVYLLAAKVGIDAYLEEHNGTDPANYSGYNRFEYDFFVTNPILPYSKVHIKLQLAKLVERGFVLVKAENESGFKKPNTYRANVTKIKEAMAEHGFLINFGKQDLSQYDYQEDTSADDMITAPDLSTEVQIVEIEPPPSTQNVVDVVDEQAKAWDALPSVAKKSTAAGVLKLENAKKAALWAQGNRTLQRLDEFTKEISWIFAEITNIQPSGSANTWKQAITLLWNACDSKQELFVRALQLGEEKRLSDGLFMKGPRSYVFCAQHVKTLNSRGMQQAYQEATKQQAKVPTEPVRAGAPRLQPGQKPLRVGIAAYGRS